MATINKGEADRSILNTVGIPDKFVDKTDDDKKIKAPPGGSLVVAQDMTNIDAFIEAQDAAKESGKKADLTEQAPSPADEVDNFLLGVDDGSIDLNNLDFQVSSSDVPLQGKFDRLKYLRTLRKDNRITNSRYISLTAPLKLSIEEAALLEAQEIGRDVDPDEISSDPILMYKYGLIELDDDLAETIEELQRAGVDVTADVPFNIRVQVGRQSSEEAKLQALENLKEDGQILFYKPTKLGMVITIPEFNEQGGQIGTKDVLFDELGLDGNDFLDIISEIPGIGFNIAAVTTAIALSPAMATAGMGIAGLTAISAGSYFLGASASDIINRIFSKNQLLAIDEIAKTRGIEAAIGGILEFALMHGVNFTKGVTNKLIGPLAGGGDETIKKYLTKITQDKMVTQYNPDGSIKYVKNKDGEYVPAMGSVQMSAGLETQSKTIQRVEAIAEKVPGGSDILKQQQEIIERQLLELEMQAKGIDPVYPVDPRGQVTYNTENVKSSVEVGTMVSRYVSKQLNEAENVIGTERTNVKTQVDADLDSIAASMSSDGRTVTSSLNVGDNAIDAVNQNYKSYIKEYDTKVGNFKNIDGYNGEATIDAGGINKLAAEIEKTYPTSTKIIQTTKAPFSETQQKYILPKQLQGVLDDLKSLDNLTVDQALNMQKILNENLSGATIPTDTDRLILQVIGKLDNSIGTEMSAMGKNVVDAYNDFAQYTLTGRIYNNPIIKNMLDGNADPVKVITPAYMSGDFKTIRVFEQALGKDNPILQDAKSAAFNEMIRKSKSSLGDGDFINAGSLHSQIQAMSPDAQKMLFGKNYKKIKNLIDVLAVENGTIDISKLANMKGTLVQKLQKIKSLEDAAQKNYKNKIIKPFLQDRIGETDINSGEFVRYFLKNAQSPEITKIMDLFSSSMQETIRKRVIQEILESGRTADPDLILKEVATGQTPPHRELYNAILEFGGKDFKEANAKLTAILGKDTFNLLNDIAGIQVARRVVSKEAAAAGGLVSGSIISNILKLQLRSAGSVIKYRITAKILSNPVGKAWLSSQLKLPPTGMKTANIVFAGPEIFKLVNEEFKNEPDNLKIALKALEDNNKEYAERAKEDREYNEKVLQNRINIEEANERPTGPSPEQGAVDTVPEPVDPAPATSTVNDASRLATAFNPAPLNTNTGPMNPNTMAKGQQLFGGPGEITFAAEGGIMNARKPIQRVA
jgi:hypothetical protein